MQIFMMNFGRLQDLISSLSLRLLVIVIKPQKHRNSSSFLNMKIVTFK
jgi:hypothetical protein